MEILGIICSEELEEKLSRKHRVSCEEVAEVLQNKPRIFFEENGYRENEHLYSAWGQTDEGRYLIVFFIYKRTQEALILTARNMTKNERKRYDKK